MNGEILEYYNYVKSKKRLSCNELTILLNKNDNLSKKQFIDAYLYYVFGFAYHIYMNFKKDIVFDYPLMDFIQDGNLLLHEMVYNQKCMNDIGVFNMYFWLDLKRVLERHIIPTKTRISISMLRKVLNTIDEFYRINQREATVLESMQLTSYSKPVIESILIVGDVDVLEFDDEYLSNYLGYDEFEDEAIERLNQKYDREIIDICMKSLNEKEVSIVASLYGLLDGMPRTLNEVSCIYGVSRQYIHEINKKALRKMKRENYRILKKYHSN